MADADPKDVPDLDLPPPRALLSTPPSASAPSSASMPVEAGRPSHSLGGIAREPPVSSDDEPFEMEIERGGAFVPSAAAKGSSPTQPGPGAARDRSRLEVTYRRLDPRAPVVDAGPSIAVRIAAWAVPVVVFGLVAALLVKFGHRPGGTPIASLAPRAFDASSALQSGALALASLASAIGLGVIGLRLTPRSYAMISSAAALLVASLAMVTVTLVATEEQPTPPDGALLLPYVVPVALALLGLGLTRRGTLLFLEGGARIAGAVLAAAMGGSLVFAALELSALAARLP